MALFGVAARLSGRPAPFELAVLSWDKHLRESADIKRPEVGVLVGDPTKAHEQLGWRAKVGFEQLVDLMVHAGKEGEDVKPGAGPASASGTSL